MAGIRKFLGGVVSGGLVAALTLVVASQLSSPTVEANGAEADAAKSAGVAAPVPEAVAAPAAVSVAEPATVDGAPVLGGDVPQGAGGVVAEPTPVAEEAVADADVSGTADAGQPAAAGAEVTADAAGDVAAAAEQPAEGTALPTTDSAALAVADGVPANNEAAAVLTDVTATPEGAAVPDVPPTLSATDAPEQSVPAAGDSAPKPASEAAVAVIAQAPVALVAPGPDGAPAGAELPPPPPLTPEEEAMLADPAQLIVPGTGAAETTSPAVGDVAVAAPETETDPAPEGTPAAQVVPEQAAEPVAEATGKPAPDAVDVVEPPSGAAVSGAAVSGAPASGAAVSGAPASGAPALPAPDAAAPEVAVTDAQETPPAAEQSVVVVDDAPERLVPDAGLGSGGPSTLPSVPSLITAGEGSLTDRDDAAPPAAELAEAPADSTLPDIALDDAPALERFAAPFVNADGKPLFGIVLIDSGDAALDRQAAASLPFPVSFVIDPLSPDAAAHAALYRAGGKEVIMLASGIPDGATPADVEQTFQALGAVLPEAVALIDTSDGAFQNNRPLASQIVPILAAQGRGLMTWDRGLNAADQVARREGLPTSLIFRQIDAEGESVPVMRRYLDRAAFKAAQDGEAVVVGTVRPETLAAILEWSIEGRASSVALAPASALLGAP